MVDRHRATMGEMVYRVRQRPNGRPDLSEPNRLVGDFDLRGAAEPARFAEPGIFLIRPDRTVYFAAVQSMPFGRPHFSEILSAIDFVLKHDDPARGEA
jgi:hypothetical protein